MSRTSIRWIQLGMQSWQKYKPCAPPEAPTLAHQRVIPLFRRDLLTIHTPHRLLLATTLHHHLHSSCSFWSSMEKIQWGGSTRPSSTSNTKALELIDESNSPFSHGGHRTTVASLAYKISRTTYLVRIHQGSLASLWSYRIRKLCLVWSKLQ